LILLPKHGKLRRTIRLDKAPVLREELLALILAHLLDDYGNVPRNDMLLYSFKVTPPVG
jgi:hypothetical protein